MKWLGLAWDEFYKQSDRFELYRQYADKLIREGKPTEAAMDLLGAMRATLNEIQTHIDYLRETADRRE